MAGPGRACGRAGWRARRVGDFRVRGAAGSGWARGAVARDILFM